MGLFLLFHFREGLMNMPGLALAAQAGLELEILLPQSSSSKTHRQVPPGPALQAHSFEKLPSP